VFPKNPNIKSFSYISTFERQSTFADLFFPTSRLLRLSRKSVSLCYCIQYSDIRRVSKGNIGFAESGGFDALKLLGDWTISMLVCAWNLVDLIPIRILIPQLRRDSAVSFPP